MQSCIATSQCRLLAAGFLLLGHSLLPSAPAIAQAACAPIPNGLVSWWRAEGNASDSWGSNDGVLANGASIVSSGKVGKAFRFDGVNDQVFIPDSASLKFSNTSSFTIELWWNRSLNNLPFHVLGKRPSCSPPPYYQVGIDSSFPTSIRSLNTWIHVAVVYNVADNLEHYYVNGTEVKTLPRRNTSPTVADLLIGGSGSCAHFGGLADEVSIYNRALTATEIQSISTADSLGKCPPSYPVGAADWELEEGTGVGFLDSRSGGVRNNGVLVNGATYTSSTHSSASKYSVSLDGFDDIAAIPDSPTLRPARITVEAWIKPQSGARVVIGKQFGTNCCVNSYQIELNPFRFQLTDTAGLAHYITASSNPVNNQWQHVAGTWDGTTMKLYLNKVLIGSGAFTGTIGYDRNPVLIGGDDDGSGVPGNALFKGLVDRVRISNIALTPGGMLP